MLRVVTANLNGIRSATKKGFFEWLATKNADIVCLQETKAQEHQIPEPFYRLDGYKCTFFDAHKKGYSGVAIYSKTAPVNITTGLGWPIADTEGRYIQYDFADLSIASLYLPSGTSGDHRQKEKYNFMDKFLVVLKNILASKKSFIICGDWNIAHKNIDLKNWRSNQNKTGFLPEERAWLDKLFDEIGFVDAFRVVNQQPDQYTWWSNYANSWDNNVGWRIDYHIVTPDLKGKILAAEIYRGQKFSDHAPLILDYNLNL
ncbi:MAG: exodeoxyribonuclease III [Gammaproteobacteria bacterium]|nr:exodeoxyribonuclease III [Gammaproteobacteria bacterium]